MRARNIHAERGGIYLGRPRATFSHTHNNGENVNTDTVPLGDGVHCGLDESVYHADPCDNPSLNASIVKVIAQQSPAHAHAAHPRYGGARSEPSDAMSEGALLHKLLLGSGPEIAVMDYDSWRTKAAREAKADALEAGQVPMLRDKYDELCASVDPIRSRLDAMGVSFDGQSEVTLIWTEQTEHGPVRCRARLDHLHQAPLITDLKSTKSAALPAIEHAFARYGYHLQEYHYTRGLMHLMPDVARELRFQFAFFEARAPFAARMVRSSGAMRKLAEMQWETALATFARCQALGEWPDYSAEGVAVIEPKPWQLDEAMMEGVEDGE